MCVFWMCQGTPAEKKRRCDGGRVGRGAVQRLGAAVCKGEKESPELWRPRLPLEKELCHLWRRLLHGWETPSHQQQKLLSRLFHLTSSSGNRKFDLPGRLISLSLALHAHLASSSRRNGSVLTPHPWDNKVGFAYAAKKCQVSLFDSACPLPRAGLWLPLLN